MEPVESAITFDNKAAEIIAGLRADRELSEQIEKFNRMESDNKGKAVGTFFSGMLGLASIGAKYDDSKRKQKERLHALDNAILFKTASLLKEHAKDFPQEQQQVLLNRVKSALTNWYEQEIKPGIFSTGIHRGFSKVLGQKSGIGQSSGVQVSAGATLADLRRSVSIESIASQRASVGR
jgi:hypothetical protein